MKKITLLFTMLLAATFSWQAQAQFPEGFETAVPPTGWTSFIGTNGEGTVQDWETTTTVNTGSQAAFVGYESVANSAEDWLVTPQFTPTVGAPILTFMQRQAYTGDWATSYTIRVSSTSQATHADFTIVDTQVELDFNTIYNEHNVDLSAYVGTPIYVAFVMEQNDGDSWYIDDVNLIPNANPPNCADTPSPADIATNVVLSGGSVTLSWTPSATGDPATSYEIFWGTASGSLSSLGPISATTVDITNIDFSTTYYWSIVPSNAGGSAVGCAELSFTTQAAPVGVLCTNAIAIGALPYNTSDDTANYGDDYSGSPGTTGCSTTNSYLNGDDVVYEYTAAADGFINVALTSLGTTYSGIFVYTDCADIGTTCAQGVANSGSADRVFDLTVTNGTTYYIVISTWASPQSTTYTLDITENTCANATATFNIVDDCANSGGFFIEVNTTDLGSATSLTAFDGTTSMPITATGTVQFGPYTNATDVTITITNDQDNSCQLTSGVLTQAVCPPSNDDCSGATVLTPGNVFGDNLVDGTVVGATVGSETAGCGVNGAGVWYSIVVPSDGNITIEVGPDIGTGDIGFDSVLEVFTGTCGALVSIDCDDDGAVTDSFSLLDLIGLAPGSTIFVRVWRYGGNEVEPFAISAYNASLSVEDNIIEGFSIYPNPVNDVLRFRAQDNIDNISIYNLLGQEVLRVQPRALSTQIDMIDLPTGMYVVKVQVGDQLGAYRIVKK